MESLSNATPPLVRWTGGLVDTVRPHTSPDGTGFGFGGRTRDEILRNFINTVREALSLYKENQVTFRELQHRAFRERFLWSDATKKYIKNLYAPLIDNRKNT